MDNKAAIAEQKRPSRVIDLEDKRFKVRERKSSDYNYGKLSYGEHEGSTKKASLKTFFGNPQSEVFCLKYSDDDTMVASGNGDGSIKLFSITSGKLIFNKQSSTGSQQTPTTQLAWKPNSDNKFLYTTNADGSIVIWNSTSGQLLEKVVENNQVLCIDFVQDGSKFATGGKDYHVKVYDDETMKVIHDFAPQEYEQLGHSNRVFAAKFLKDQPDVLLTGGWDSTVMIWDIRQKTPVDQIQGPNITGGALDYKNGTILTGSYRNSDQLELFDFKQRQKLQTIPWNNDGTASDKVYCYCAQFTKQDEGLNVMAGCTGDNTLKMFDSANNYAPSLSVVDMKEGIFSCDYGNSSSRFAFAGGEGVVYIMSLLDTSL